MKDFTVKLLVFLVRAFLWRLHPKRMNLVQQLRSSLNLVFLLFFLLLFFLLRSFPILRIRRCFFSGRLLVRFFFLRLDFLKDDIVVSLLTLFHRFGTVFLLLGQIDLIRHERAVFLNHFPGLIFIAEFQAVVA